MTGRRDRSRSPMRGDNGIRRRDIKGLDQNKNPDNMPNVMNPMIMPNIYPQGNMMMPGMFNMMMPNHIMGGGMMQAPAMDMMQGPAMEMIPQPSLDMAAIGNHQALPPAPPPVEMGMIGGVMMDPMMGMFPNMGVDTSQEKKEIILKHSKLIPPAPGTPLPPRRARPPGCRTIFVGGLPDKIREGTVREIFERYGRIQILRLSKKNFCHIRFDRESCVDAAMVVSGYRIKISPKEKDENEDDDDSHGTIGWLHVDYALSRDDQNEYERRQRQALRVQQQQIQQQLSAQEAIANRNINYRRSPSPFRIQPFSNAAIVQLAEKIKNEEHFSSTLPTLISWLERGECSKKNSNQFYSMIQATNSHIRRLFNEKMQYEEELLEYREKIKKQILGVLEQLEQVAKVFSAATHQRVWDHFTKPQRKNIETWQKMTQEFNTLKEDFQEKFLGDDIDLNGLSNRVNKAADADALQDLKRENESLRFQLEAYKNEVDVIKADAQKEMEKFKAQFIARQALQDVLEKDSPLPSPVDNPPTSPPLPEEPDAKAVPCEDADVKSGEAKLIGIMSAFLQVHPQGASLDYVVSYVRALFPDVSQSTIHYVLQRHGDVFQRTTSGVGANIEHRWTFVAFHTDK